MAKYSLTDVNTDIDSTDNRGFFSIAYDSTHFLVLQSVGTGTSGDAQVAIINTSTWAVTTGATLGWAADCCKWMTGAKIDTTHFLAIWQGINDDTSVAQVLLVNGTTWAVTTAGAAKSITISIGDGNTCSMIDANHAIHFYSGSGNDGYVGVLTINTSTWAITTAATPLEFETSQNSYNNCVKLDSNHFLNCFQGTDYDGFAQVFTVNTSTWAVTTAAAALEIDTAGYYHNACMLIDSNHALACWGTDTNAGVCYAQVLTINTTTWAVSTTAAKFTFNADHPYYLYSFTGGGGSMIDANHALITWNDQIYDSQAYVFEFNTSTWAITTKYLLQDGLVYPGNPLQIDTTHFFVAECSVDDVYGTVFVVNLSPTAAKLKTWNTIARANLATWNTCTDVKTLNSIP